MRLSYVLWVAGLLTFTSWTAWGGHQRKLSALDLKPRFLASSSPAAPLPLSAPNKNEIQSERSSSIVIEATCIDSKGLLYSSEQAGYRSCEDEIGQANPPRWPQQQTVGIAIRR